MVVFEVALFVAGFGAGLAGGYAVATDDSESASSGATDDGTDSKADDTLGDTRYQTVAENFPRGSIALLNENREFTLVAGQVFDGIVDEVSEEVFVEEALCRGVRAFYPHRQLSVCLSRATT